MKKKKQTIAGPREDVRAAIERIWPNGMVEMTFDSNKSYFWDVYPKLDYALHRLKNARIVHEIEPEVEPVWYDDSDPIEDPPDEQGDSRSYHLFFVSPNGDVYSYEVSIDSPPEPGEAEPIETPHGSGISGWSVAVSLLAPYAVINPCEMEVFDNGMTTEPSLEWLQFNETGEPLDPETHFKEIWCEEAVKDFFELRSRISAVLGKHGITVLDEEEWRKPVRGLGAGDEVFTDIPGRELRVLDAFFFEGV